MCIVNNPDHPVFGGNDIIKPALSTCCIAQALQHMVFIFFEANSSPINCKQVVGIEFADESKMNLLVVDCHYQSCQYILKDLSLEVCSCLQAIAVLSGCRVLQHYITTLVIYI